MSTNGDSFQVSRLEQQNSLLEPEPFRLSNRGLARLVVAGMAVIAIIGLTYALWTTNLRREHDRQRSKNFPLAPLPESNALLEPVQLPALAYMPPDCFAIAGFHLAQLESREEGRKMLEIINRGLLGSAPKQIEKWTGFAEKELANLSAGIRQRRGLPELIVILRTRQPYDLERLEKHFNPARPTPHRGRPAFRFANNMVGGGWVWCLNPQTLAILFSLDSDIDSLDGIPTEPQAAEKFLAPDLQKLLTRRLNPECFLWLVADLSKLQGLGDLVRKDAQGKNQVAEILKQVHLVGAGSYFLKGLTTSISLQATSTKNANLLEKKWRELLPKDDPAFKIVGPTPGSNSPSPSEDTWLTIQMRTPVDQFGETLEKLKQVIPLVP